MQKTNELSSVKNALKILKAFKMESHQKGVLELSAELGISKSSVHRLLKTLESEGFVTKAQSNAKYELGMSVIELNSIYLRHLDIFDATFDSLLNLVNKTKETSHLAILKDDAIVYINKLNYQETVEIESHIGYENQIHCTGCGRVLLAYSSNETIHRILDQPLKKFTTNTIVDKNLLLKELDKVKKQSYAIVIGEFRSSTTSIAYPIKNLQGKVIAAINIVAPTKTLTNDKIKYYVQLLREEASEIRKKINYFPFF